MKIYNADTLRKWDSATIERQGITGPYLMYRAGITCANLILAKYGLRKYYICCGPGNNGGDGYVIAKFLFEHGAAVEIILAVEPNQIKGDAFEHFKHLSTEIKITPWENFDFKIKEGHIYIDALFGNGMQRPLEESIYGKGIRALSAHHTISIDLPSGIPTQGVWEDGTLPQLAVKAKETYIFQTPKIPVFFAETASFFGEWQCVDIGLDSNFELETEADYEYIHQINITPKEEPFSHKYHRGHVLLITGSEGKEGAAILAAQGALKSGVGLVTAHIPEQAKTALLCRNPEVMTMFQGHEIPKACRIIGAGPGLGDRAESLLPSYLSIHTGAWVLDADAIQETYIDKASRPLCITPHTGEFERLSGRKFKNSYETLAAAREMAIKKDIYIVLKGAYTRVIFPNGKVYFNGSGNSAMARGGAGDVLLGMISGMAARHIPFGDAIIRAVYQHGRRGDELKAEFGEDGVWPGLY